MNADVFIKGVVQHKVRFVDEPWKQTQMFHYPFDFQTTLDSYLSDTGNFSEAIFASVGTCRLQGGEVGVHVSATLDNVSHPEVAAGVVKLPKSHIDFAYTDIELATAQRIEDDLNKFLANMKATAKY